MKSKLHHYLLCSVASFSFSLSTITYAQNSWTQKTDFGGTARYTATCFTIGNKGYVSTGYDGSSRHKDLWEWNQATNVWTQKSDFGGTARSGAVGFSIGTKGYIGTGYNGSYFDDFWEWNQSTNTWTQKTNFGGSGRHAAVGFSIGTKGYIGTGYNGNYLNDFWEWDQSSDTWTQKNNFAGTTRRFAVGFSIATKGYIGTGYNGSDLNDFWEWDQSSDTWTQKNNFAGTSRRFAVGFSIATKGYIGTGYDGSYLNDFWEWDQGSNTWVQNINFGGTVRSNAIGFSIGNKGYIGTGYGTSYLNDFWEGQFCATPSPTITAGGSTTLCSGKSVTLTSSTAISYSWSNSATTKSITVSTPGNFFVTTSDSTGCSASSNTISVSNVNLGASASPSSLCNGAGTVQLFASSGSSFSDNFDPMVSSLWSDIDGIESNDCGSVSGNALYFNTSSSRVAATINLNTTAGGTITFSLKIGTGADINCDNAESGEDITLEYSNNGGSSWTIIKTYYTGTTYQNFTSVTETIPVGAKTNATRFRWTQLSHSGGGFDNWAIDNVSISSGGGGNYTYQWAPTTGLSSSTIANPTATISTSTKYVVTGTETSSGCKDTASVSVVISNMPDTASINPKGPIILCYGDSVKLTTNSGTGYLYSWSNYATTQSIMVKQPGYYSVTISDAYGCKAFSNYVTVNSSSGVNATASNTYPCLNDTIQLFAINSSTFYDDFENYNYLWTNNDGSRNASCGSVSGYALNFINSSGLREATTKDLNVSSGGSISFYLKIDYGTGAMCDETEGGAGKDVLLRYSKDGGANWQSISTYAAGTATYRNFASVTVQIPTAALSTATRFQWIQSLNDGYGKDSWALDNVLITSNNYSYKWSPTTGLSNPNIINPKAIILAPMNYKVTVTNIASTCNEVDSVSITLNSYSRNAYINPYGPTTFCTGGSVNLSSSSGSSYLWSDGSSYQSITVTTSGNYVVTVTNPNGCQGLAISKPVTVNVTNVPTAAITPSGSIEICNGNNVKLEANDGSSWQWSNGSYYQDIYVNTAGTYTVTITDAGGCTGSAVSAPVKVTTEIRPTKPAIVRDGYNLITDLQSRPYQWFYFDVPIAGANSKKITCSKTGVYSVAVGNINGCFTMSDTVVFILPPSGISESYQKQVIKIFPNPTSGEIFIETGEIKGTQIKIFNVLGELVYSETISKPAVRRKISIDYFPSGVYILMFQTNDTFYHAQFIKE